MSAESEKAPRISRRDFVKGTATGAALLTGASAIAACGSEAEPAAAPGIPEKWDEEADVVVVGAGGTGLVAAIAALEAGASVAVLDKATVVGGTTAVSGGVIQASMTGFQMAAGVEGDTPEAHHEYWLAAGEGIADPELVRVMAENTPDNIQWLMDHGINYVSVYGVDPIPYVNPAVLVPRIHVPAGQGETAQVGTDAVHLEILHSVAQERAPRRGSLFVDRTPLSRG